MLDDALADTPERMQLEIAFANEAIGLATEFIERGRMSWRATISSLFLARAIQSMQSCILLSERGARGDAMSVSRTIVELDIDHAYIMQTETERRWELFVLFDATSTNRLLNGISLIPGSSVAPETIEKWREAARDARARAGDDRSWAGRGMDTRQRAIATGRQLQYDVAFRDMCGASHSGFSTFAYVTDLNAQGFPIRILIGFDSPSAKALALSIASMLGLLKAAVADTTDPDDFRARVQDLDRRYMATSGRATAAADESLRQLRHLQTRRKDVGLCCELDDAMTVEDHLQNVRAVCAAKDSRSPDMQTLDAGIERLTGERNLERAMQQATHEHDELSERCW